MLGHAKLTFIAIEGSNLLRFPIFKPKTLVFLIHIAIANLCLQICDSAKGCIIIIIDTNKHPNITTSRTSKVADNEKIEMK